MLKLFLIFSSIVLTSSSDICTDQQLSDFENYKQNFNKTYAHPSVEERALKCFCKQDNKIKEHNANNLDYQQGHNKDSDGCNRVGSSYKTGYKHDNKKVAQGSQLPMEARKVGAAPGGQRVNNGVDYKSLTSNVKNQGNCGCCWASSAASVLSYHNAMYGNKKVVEFSDQFFIDCVRESFGCAGGYPMSAYQMGINGVPLENNYKFVGRNGTCKSFTSEYKCKKPAYACPQGNEALLLNLLENYGPGVVLINTLSCPSLTSYSSGIFYNSKCANMKNQVDHAVTLVGHGIDSRSKQGYWIVKNSWGSEWGEGGYFRVRRGSNQMNIAYCFFIPCPPQLPQCA